MLLPQCGRKDRTMYTNWFNAREYRDIYVPKMVLTIRLGFVIKLFPTIGIHSFFSLVGLWGLRIKSILFLFQHISILWYYSLPPYFPSWNFVSLRKRVCWSHILNQAFCFVGGLEIKSVVRLRTESHIAR